MLTHSRKSFQGSVAIFFPSLKIPTVILMYGTQKLPSDMEAVLCDCEWPGCYATAAGNMSATLTAALNLLSIYSGNDTFKTF